MGHLPKNNFVNTNGVENRAGTLVLSKDMNATKIKNLS